MADQNVIDPSQTLIEYQMLTFRTHVHRESDPGEESIYEQINKNIINNKYSIELAWWVRFGETLVEFLFCMILTSRTCK